jgi:LysM repeat protein
MSLQLLKCVQPAPRGKSFEITESKHPLIIRERSRPAVADMINRENGRQSKRNFVMAADVKIGLLLGIIFVISTALVLSSLPYSDHVKENNGLKSLMGSDPPGLKPEIRPEAFPPYPIRERRRKQMPRPSKDMEPVRGLLGTTSPDEISKHTKLMESSWPEVYYVVQKGDTLADIAKRFYGPEQGNRRANVMRIFEANRKLLESSDKIYPNQKLIIPSLRVSTPDKNRFEGNSMFEKVESVGRRHL